MGAERVRRAGVGCVGRPGVSGPGGLPSPFVTSHRQGYPDGSNQGGGYPAGYPDSGSGYPGYPDQQGQPGQGVGPSSGGPAQGWPGEPTGYGERRFAESIPRYPDGGYPGGQPQQQQQQQPGPYREDDLRLDAGDLRGQAGQGGGQGGLDSPTTVTPAHPGPARPAAQPGGAAPLSDLLSSPTEAVDAYRPPAAQQNADAGVYRTGGRPQLALGLAIATIVFEIPVAVLLVRSMVGAGLAVGGLVAGLFLLPGLPLFAAGLYGVFSGKVTARPGDGWAAVVRPPMALLLCGVLLLVCAALAAG
jgi:hypothetical protein